MTDLNALYPDDVPSGPAPARSAGPVTRQVGATEAVLYPDDQPKDAARAKPQGDDEPATLTYADAAKFDARELTSFFDQTALAAIQDGDRERAAELGQAGKALVDEFATAGTPSETVSDALRAYQDAAYSGVTEAPEAIMAQLSQEFGPSLEADLAAARQLIIELDRKAPGLIDDLNATGAGNDPRIIRAAISEARRRGLGRR